MQVPDVRSNGRVTFVLTYDELLKRVRGQYEQRINVAPQQVRIPMMDFPCLTNKRILFHYLFPYLILSPLHSLSTAPFTLFTLFTHSLLFYTLM